VDCGALTKELAGSELWGHEKGSFTGAVNAKPGQFELANGGTIFLDEISNLSYDIQVGLLRLVQERKLRRVGGVKDIEIDVRIIVASNENLKLAAQKGKFREDLYYRFNEFTVNVPSLREMQEDVMLFAEHFLQEANEELGKQILGFDDKVQDLFKRYNWPGNLRELRNVVRRAALLTDTSCIEASSLPQEIVFFDRFITSVAPEPRHPEEEKVVIESPKPEMPIDLKAASAQAEAEVLRKVLEDVKYNRTKAALKLGIDRKTLFNKMKQYNL
jgi:two-component system response regulator HydG